MSPRPPAPSPVDRSPGVPPDDADWRSDARGRSRHSRLEEFLRRPADDRDPQRAAEICAEVARRGLRDFAPALLLLPPAERRRAQALAAFALTLFDFARQSGLEGEKLAQINRWHFDLESSLDGAPPAQPVFLMLAETGTESPWPRRSLDEIVACARHRALHRRPGTAADAAVESERLATALAGALLPGGGGEIVPLAVALLRASRLLDLGDDSRRHQAGLPEAALPERWGSSTPEDPERLAVALRAECRELLSRLEARPAAAGLPRPWRHAARYLRLAARRLVESLHAAGAGALETRPRLGAWRRLALLARSRLRAG